MEICYFKTKFDFTDQGYIDVKCNTFSIAFVYKRAIFPSLA